jgi:hypothetical protein
VVGPKLYIQNRIEPNAMPLIENNPLTIADNLRNIFGAILAGRQNLRNGMGNIVHRNLAVANLATLGTQYGYDHPVTQRAMQEYLKREAQMPENQPFVPEPQNYPPQVPDALSGTGP